MSLLVLALTALICLAAAYQLYAVPRDELAGVIRTQLQIAQNNPGQLVSERVRVYEGTTVSAKTFETARAGLSFECSDSASCCAKNEPCRLVRWEDRVATMATNPSIYVTSRCIPSEDAQMECTTYFGTPPAQLAIKNGSLIDTNLIVVIQNTGNSLLLMDAARIEYLERVEKSGIVAYDKRFEERAVPPFRTILPGAEERWSMGLSYAQPGTYRVRLTLHSLKGGQAIKEFEYRILPHRTACKIAPAENANVFQNPQTGECFERLFCSECQYAFECQEKWRVQGKTNTESATPDFAIARVRCT